MIEPFGTDDDDIELNYLLDRHIQASFVIVNLSHNQQPPLVADKFFETQKFSVPHTKMSAKLKEHSPKLHAFVDINKADDEEVHSGVDSSKKGLLPTEKKRRYFFTSLCEIFCVKC